MSQSETEKCLNHPKFKKLVKARGQINFLFSMIIVVSYGIYVLGISFAPEFMTQRLNDGSSMTYGILIAVLVIIIGMVTSGVYTWWANRSFDTMKQELLEDLGHE